MLTTGRYSRSQELFARAQALIPGGRHLAGNPLLPAGLAPLYIESGAGCRCRDVDGNQYIDFMMAFGPFLLGYANPEVDRAAIEQIARGNLLSMNHPLHIAFIERLVERFPAAEMGVFFKTGSEATTAALRLARRATGRRKVARCGYHGWHDWCLPLEDFVPAGLEDQVLEFIGSQPTTLANLLDAHQGQVAAVILAPEMILNPQPQVFQELMAITHRHGSVFILDEVKTALRIRPGSIQQLFDLAPDITTLSKALGNGWPVAALVGKRAVLEHGKGMHYSATFHGDTGAISAALKVLDVCDREPVAEHVWRLGERLIEGLNQACRRHRIPARAFGEPLPPMPFLAFEASDSEYNERLKQAFYYEMFQAGVLLHPRHMWFISYAHSEDDIERTLEAADRSLQKASGQL